MNDRSRWVDTQVSAVVKSLMDDVALYDDGEIGMGTLTGRVLDTIRTTINSTYDVGFNDGLVETADEDEYEDTQLEFDLDDLRKQGEEDAE